MLVHQEALRERATDSVTVARNPLSTHMWLMFKIFVWHAKKNIDYIHCKCRNFCSMSHDLKMAVVKKNALCINCLRPGHFLKG